jgi:hypothetical protein
MKPDGMIRCYYDFDLGPFGPMVFNLAVQSWLKRARNSDSRSGARRRVAGFHRHFDLQPNLRAGGRM